VRDDGNNDEYDDAENRRRCRWRKAAKTMAASRRRRGTGKKASGRA